MLVARSGGQSAVSHGHPQSYSSCKPASAAAHEDHVLSMKARMTMLEALERVDADAWAAPLAPDAVVRLANRPAIYGRQNSRDAVAELCDGICSIRHDVIEVFEHGDTTVIEATVTFLRTNGAEVQLPAVTIMRANQLHEIADYRVYFNPTPLQAAQ